MARTKGVKSEVGMTELGGTGLKQYGGVIGEEFHPKLRGSQGIKVYTEMRDNDPIIGAILFIIDKLLRNVTWTVTPANETPAAKEQAEFVEECMKDMEHSWESFIGEILSMLTFGYSPHEIVYKIRGGYSENAGFNSRYDDGKIGWKKLPIRSQETIFKWNISDNGDIKGVTQLIPGTGGGEKYIPVAKLLLFRTQSYKNNPEGRSVLRNAYRSWYFKKRIEEVEGIGIERDLAGLPVAHVPPSLLDSNAGASEKATLAVLKQLITNIRRDEQEGVIFPLAYDENGKELYKLELLSTGGTRQFDTSEIVTRYDKRIAMTVLADFIFLGQDKVGSFALSSDKTSLFGVALGAWLKDIASVINRDAIPSLMRVNNVSQELWPEVKPGDVEKENVSEFAEVIYKLVGVGALIPDDSVDAKLRTLLGLPLTPSDGNDIKPIDFIEQRFELGEISPTDPQADFRNTGDPAVADGKGKKPTGDSKAKAKLADKKKVKL